MLDFTNPSTLPSLLAPDKRQVAVELLRRRTEERIRYFRPNPGAQEAFLHSITTHREVAYFAGNKSGKTYTAAYATVAAALGSDARKYGMTPLYERPIAAWVGSVNYKVQREAAQPLVLHFLPPKEIKKIHWLQNGTIDFIALINGSTIGFKTYDQGREAWQGPVKDWIWMDEEGPEAVIKEARSRLTGANSKLIFTLTPLLGLSYLYHEFFESPIFYRTHVTGSTYENKEHLDPLYLKAQEQLPEDEQQSRLYGNFVRLGGLVYKEFDAQTHVLPHFEPNTKDFLFLQGMDFGADHPTAFVMAGIDQDQNVYVFREYKKADLPIGDHATTWLSITKGYEVQRIFSDPSAKQARIELRRKPFQLTLIPGVRDRAVGISLIRTLLKNNKLFISSDCKDLIYEFQHHQHKHTDNEEQKDADVKKVDDDLLDALRYMVASFFKQRKKEPLPENTRLKSDAAKGIHW